jgi:hypothetical protein
MEMIEERQEERRQEAQYGDRDCSDFPSQHGAQAFYEANGGPRSDPHLLDEDRDGIACEALR